VDGTAASVDTMDMMDTVVTDMVDTATVENLPPSSRLSS
jgi:hypothetical protein